MFLTFYVSICSNFIKISLIDIAIRIPFILAILNISICTKLHIFFAQFESRNKTELFFLHILTLSDYMSYKAWWIKYDEIMMYDDMTQNIKHTSKLFLYRF